MSGPLVAIVALVVAAIAFGTWLWSIRSVDDPIDANAVDAYAVVVSSPLCTAGSGATAIDLDISPATRSSISACGRRVGERLAVQYLAGHPDRARLAGTALAHNNSAARWLPIAILGAGLLAVLGTVSLLFDRRRSRHDARSNAPGARLTVSQLRAGAVGPEAVATGTEPRMPHTDSPAPGTEAGASDTDPGAADKSPGATGNGPGAIDMNRMTTDADLATTADDPEAGERISRHSAVSAGAHPLRLADIALDDELFTHRGPHLS